MDSCQEREIMVTDSLVVPGYLYDAALKRFYPRKDGKTFTCVKRPVEFKIDIWDMKTIISYVERTGAYFQSQWEKDFLREQPVGAVFIKGVKIQRETAKNIVLDSFKSTVTSIIYENRVDMFIMLKKRLAKEDLPKIQGYLLNKLYEKRIDSIPTEILHNFDSAFIYQRSDSTGNKEMEGSYSLIKFCRILKNARDNSLRRALILGPSHSAGAQSNVDKISPHSIRVASTAKTLKPTIYVIDTPGVHGTRNSNQKEFYRKQLHTNSQRGISHSNIQARSDNEQSEISYCMRGITDTIARRLPCNTEPAVTSKRYIYNTAPEKYATSSVLNQHDKVGLAYSLQNNPRSAKHGSIKFQRVSFKLQTNNGKVITTQPKRGTKLSESNTATSLDEYLQCTNGSDYSKSYDSQDTIVTNPTSYLQCSRSRENAFGSDSFAGVCSSRSFLDADVLHPSIRTNHLAQKIEDTDRKDDTMNPQGSKGYNIYETTSGTNKGFFQKSNSLPQNLKNTYIKQFIYSDNSIYKDIDETNNHRYSEKEENQITAMPVQGQFCINKQGMETSNSNINDQDCNHELPHLLGLTPETDQNYTKDLSPNSNLKAMTKGNKTGIQSQRKLKKSDLNSESPQVHGNSMQNKTFCIDADDKTSVMAATPQHVHTKQGKNGKECQMRSNTISKLMVPVKVVRDSCGFERKYFGIVNGNVSEKVIILLGAAGSGKTTLINFIANYFQGNKSTDDELVHVESISQTLTITAYTFCMDDKDIPITVIDTPGLNDSSGGEIRDHVQSMKTFLANTASKKIDIHAIGFVAQAHIVRLTSSERLVMDYVSTMFNQDVSSHLITLVTFADTSDTPPVIEAMKYYKVNVRQYFKFNNSILSVRVLDEVDDLDRVYFRVCWRNWKKCLETLKHMPPLSVNSMRVVQRESNVMTITDSAKADLKAEIHALFKCHKKEKMLSDKHLQVCEHIWNLAAVVHSLTIEQHSGMKTIQILLIETAMEVCTELYVPPEDIVHILALAPSKALTVAGTEIVRSLAQAYEYDKKCSEGQVSNENLIEKAYCYVCKKDHKMKRTNLSWLEKTLTIGSDVICLRCVECSCSGNVHGLQPNKVAPKTNTIVLAAVHSLRNALHSHSLPGFIVQEETYLRRISNQLSSECREFMDAILKMVRK